jgi:hypothetical protein
MAKWAKVYSVFVYLEDVAEDNAPLDVKPGTHTFYHFLDNEEEAMLSSVYVQMPLVWGWCVFEH